MKRPTLIVLLILFLGLSGCSTIFTPNSSKLTIYDGYPRNAEVYLNDELLGTTPLELWVDNEKLRKENILEIKSPGFEPAIVDVELKIDPGYFIPQMLLVVPLAVDLYTGAIYKPFPHTIKYKLRTKK